MKTLSILLMSRTSSEGDTCVFAVLLFRALSPGVLMTVMPVGFGADGPDDDDE
ncbi:hypothetical protein SISNIDRAFT_231285 [Sistotremastrum niveocremeum HHB9708]|uniref:Uncharacterized protein n=1 Tax=Sistotremastrum niveocremeum HHB9708 TaxID=1314777 RepID=A0A164Q0D6_9AGAM|nr:hypothetical protein SISNIDRAFT_231285 [Sistotremastrum niveocremeum HHB9708]